MDKAQNKELYQQVKTDAKNKFKRFPSAYASMWIQREYKKRGGEFSEDKENDSKLSGFLQEKWVQVLPLLKDGKVVKCGDDNKDTKACRPSVRVSKDTPITIQELFDLYPVDDIIKIAEKKNADMSGRVNWNELTFTPSKNK